MDRISRKHRSWNMSRIKGRDTSPELRVRSAIHRAGYRFRLHSNKLPGRPDIVLSKHKAVVLVHGCFWHRHAKCKYATTPGTNVRFWRSKFEKTVARDKSNISKLRRLGWHVFVVWECETYADTKILRRLEGLISQKQGIQPSPVPSS
jgi:DNA mismatch endonuclease (patch repair protein)